MRTKGHCLWRLVVSIALFTGSAVFIWGAGTAAQTINLPDPGVENAAIDDDDVPDVTARVARISFIRGDAQIKRLESDEWERVTLNLPVVEGDEITTGAGSRLEIQFDNYQHLRIDENAYVKLNVLKDEGIAVSLSLGSMDLRIRRYDKDRAYFEIDAPRSTIAIQKTGRYRVDAGQSGDPEIRVAVTQGGEARVYSENSGFTVKNNRSARVFVTGDNAGEWEPVDLAGQADDFDQWSLDRDELTAKRLDDAYYDKYYDQDIYGADDLNGFGEWVFVSQYGYIWRPYSAAISTYADWSPYRYGSWRWLPPYGWTWVNDEPWGWATYHHGRWIFHSGSWYWSPYGYYRYARSWWFPALVQINFFNNSYCWYPLGYHHRWHNYNAWYNHHHGGGHQGGYHPPGPTPNPTPIGPPIRVPGKAPKPANVAVVDEIPPGGVITVGSDDFGTRTKGGRTASLSVAKHVLAQTPDDSSSPILPDYTTVSKRITPEITVQTPKTDKIAAATRVGAAPRKTDAALDNELRTTRILGGRPPVSVPPTSDGGQGDGAGARDPRKTGAVERPPVRQPPVNEPQPPIRTYPPERPPVKVAPPTDPPIRQVPPAEHPPVREPPVKQPPRAEPAPVRQPPRQDPPKSDPPSKEPPAKSGNTPDGGGKKAKSDR
jgi:hypothetical protein